MVDASIFHTPAFKKEILEAIEEGPTYICGICLKFDWRENMIKLNHSRYGKIYNGCHTVKSEYICKSCDLSLRKRK